MNQDEGRSEGGQSIQFHRRWRGGGAGRLVIIETRDVDEDGLSEIITLAGRDLKVYDWIGDTYALVAEATLPRDGLSLALGKIDLTGPETLVVGTRDNVLLYAFTPHGLTLLCQTLLYPNGYFRYVRLGDVNNDGRAEIIAAASGAQTMYLYQMLVVGAESRLEELGRLYIGGLVDARSGDRGEIVASTRDGFVDVYVPCALLPKGDQVLWVVKRGESIWRLAKRFHTSAEAIIRFNKLAEPYQLTPGQVLIIPRERPTAP